MNTLIQDLRYGLRMLAKHPGFTLVAALVTALGIGASVAIFSVVNGVLLRALPYSAAERLTMIWGDDGGQKCGQQTPGRHQHSVSYLNFRDWREQDQVFEALALYWQERGNLTGYGEPEEVAQTTVSAD